MSQLFDLSGKVALVTGGNRGIGLSFARALTRQGARVVIWGRSEARNSVAVADLGGDTCATQVDVSRESDVVSSLADIEVRFGRLDIVVVNAGIIDKKRSFTDIDSSSWRDLLATNLDGAFFTLREAAKSMIKAGAGGSIIVCGSLSVFAGTRGLQHYAAAKGALAAIVKSMASEFGEHGIRVNMIAPGYIRTESSLEGDKAAEIARRTPMRRLGTPSDLEAGIAYLASDGASFHTGDILVVDGGWLANLN